MQSRREFIATVVSAGGLAIRSPLSGYGLDAGAPPLQPESFIGRTAGEERSIEGIPLCWCPPGRFTMGSPANEAGRRPDEAQEPVTLSRGFWMAKFEVTQGQW